MASGHGPLVLGAVTQPADLVGITAPLRLHPHAEVEVDLAAQESLDVPARLDASPSATGFSQSRPFTLGELADADVVAFLVDATMIKRVGIESRRDIERLLGCKVYLDLSVRVQPQWRRDANEIRRLGYGSED